MKKYLYFLPILFVVIFVLFLFTFRRDSLNEAQPILVNQNTGREVAQEETNTSLANPASVYCEENGGKLEIVTESDGSQLGMCNLGDYSCEEWAYMNGECTIEADAEKIKDALIAKGLDLTDMKVVINKHLGKYIGGGVVPISAPAGGGYVFAVKDDSGNISIVADGNGAIMCNALDEYSDFPTYLIAECIDDKGNPVER